MPLKDPEARKAYERSPKRKESHRIRQARYSLTPAGIATNNKYEDSEKRKEQRRRYRNLSYVVAKRKEYEQRPHIKQNKREQTKRCTLKMKLTLMGLLGNKCSNPLCLVPGGCTDIRCLHIDHVNGNGYLERKQFNNNIRSVWRYYVKNPDKIKDNIQILCSNCNWIKVHENNERPYKHLTPSSIH